jgi:hypothetical protein
MAPEDFIGSTWRRGPVFKVTASGWRVPLEARGGIWL